MDAAIIASAGLLGLASVPHCALMCSAPCTAVARRTKHGPWAFHLARIASYAAGGLVAAASVGAVAGLAQSARWLLPLWTVLQVAVLLAGGYMLATGRLPSFTGITKRAPTLQPGTHPIRWGPARAAAAGAFWVAWPCGALQGALLVAALASNAFAGAAAMALFAVLSGLGLWLAPWLWGRTAGLAVQRHAVRAAGALVAFASAWALGRGLWNQASAWCG